jgi:outer membrane protein OmpA-like peptidoglycan-associated protein
MAAGCKKCDPHELCEECPEWIFTLADLIMCMMGLFVLLWVLKPQGAPQTESPAQDHMNKVVGAIRDAFGYQPDPNSNDPVDMQMIMDQLNMLKVKGPGEKGVTRREQQGAQGSDPEVTTIRTGRQTTVGGRMRFAQGDATLSREMIESLKEIVNQIRGHRNIVMIKGHASLDDIPSGTAEQKMDLSLRRAQAIADYFTQNGVSPDTLRVQGCSTFEPVRQRAYTSEMQAMNRRVEVDVTPTLVEDLEDRSTARPANSAAPHGAVRE